MKVALVISHKHTDLIHNQNCFYFSPFSEADKPNLIAVAHLWISYSVLLWSFINWVIVMNTKCSSVSVQHTTFLLKTQNIAVTSARKHKHCTVWSVDPSVVRHWILHFQSLKCKSDFTFSKTVQVSLAVNTPIGCLLRLRLHHVLHDMDFLFSISCQ